MTSKNLSSVIEAVDVRLVRIGVEPARGDAIQKFDALEIPFVFIRDKAGLQGSGIGYTIGTGGTTIVELLRKELTPKLIGEDSRCIAKIHKKLNDSIHALTPGCISSTALSAIDVALWDLAGKRTATPLHVLLGGSKEKVPIYNTNVGWLNRPLDEMLDLCREAVQKDRFKAIKLKVGKPEIDEDEERVASVRKVIGPECKLMVDANQSWSYPEAIKRAKMLEKYNLVWLEEPVLATDIDAFVRLGQHTVVPRAGGESIYAIEQFFQYLKSGALDILQPDIARIGGITNAMRVCAMAQAAGLPVAPHVSPELSVTVAAAVPNSIYVEFIPQMKPILSETVKISDGFAVPSEDPGHGIKFDEEALNRLEVQDDGKSKRENVDSSKDRTSDSNNQILLTKEAQLGERRGDINSSALEQELLKLNLEGEVRFDAGSRALYATDGSNYRQVPIGVVLPKTETDIVRALAVCRKYGAPIVSRGGGTSLAGQCCNVAVVFDMSKYYNALLELNVEEKYAWVQPGIVLDTLRDAAEQYHLTFGPDPSTHNHCTLGGMIGNNSCGVHALMAGKTVENIIELDILTYDGVRMTVGTTPPEQLEQIIEEGGRRGEIYKQLKNIRDTYADEIMARYPRIPRRVSGYNLDELLPEHGFDVAKALVGSEGTCVIVLRAKTRLVYSPPVRSLLVIGYKDKYTAADHVPEILEAKPIGLEALDEELVQYMKEKHLHADYLRLFPEGRGWLIVEFGGESKDESDDLAKKLMEQLKDKEDAPSMKLYDDKKEEQEVWKVRESGLGATARIPSTPDNWPGWEDSAVAPENLGEYLRKLQKLFEKYHFKVSLYGHFGQGCVHCRIPFDLVTADGIKSYRAFMEGASDLVLSLGGSLSGEHGDGQARAELLPKMFGDKLIQAFEEFKSAWDPEWKMNPGKVVKPNRMTENLRIGSNYEPKKLKTHFQFPDDNNDFGRVTTRCVGVGECRRHEGGTMCPSYMATREEMHSTRGRAHLLFEMLEGNPLGGGWRNETVKEALDLCLACKGCKADCPVNVDMATYKAEFLSHYYEGRFRPRHAYAFGLINWWSRLAKYVPNFANFFTQTPGFAAFAKWSADVAQDRKVPKFATTTFKQWFKKRKTNTVENPDVMLFADTFNDHFHPTTASAAVELLERAGFKIYVPMKPLCCGRPLYDFGMLKRAKSWLRIILTELKPYIENGVPMLVLEPSCMAVFKDELINFFPQDPDAQRLSQQTFLLSEFISQHKEKFSFPKLNRKALMQVHCHQKSVKGETPEEEVMKSLGVDFEIPEAGCCGMAGAFGFESDHAGVAEQIGNRNLVPAVRAADKKTLIVADGFSCRQQVFQSTDRQALHLSEIIKLAYQDSNNFLPEPYPERTIIPESELSPTATEIAIILAFTCTILILLLAGLAN